MKFLVILCCTVFYGCSSITIEPREGKLPSINIDTGVKGCKYRPKTDLDLDDVELHFICKWKFRS